MCKCSPTSDLSCSLSPDGVTCMMRRSLAWAAGKKQLPPLLVARLGRPREQFHWMESWRGKIVSERGRESHRAEPNRFFFFLPNTNRPSRPPTISGFLGFSCYFFFVHTSSALRCPSPPIPPSEKCLLMLWRRVSDVQLAGAYFYHPRPPRRIVNHQHCCIIPYFVCSSSSSLASARKTGKRREHSEAR